MKNSFFDDIIREKAHQHKADVPLAAWDTIKNKKQKRRYAAWWWAIGFLIITVGLFGVYQYKQPVTTIPLTAKNTRTGIDDKNVKEFPAGKNGRQDGKLNGGELQETGKIAAPEIADLKPASANSNDDLRQKDKIRTTKATGGRIQNTNDITLAGVKQKNKPVIYKAFNTGKLAGLDKKHNSAFMNGPSGDVASGKKKMKTQNGKTKIAIKAPVMANDETEVQPAAGTGLADNIPPVVEETVLPATNDSTVNINTTVALKPAKTAGPPIGAVKRDRVNKPLKKHDLFFDISIRPFESLQQNAAVAGLSRTTITPLDKTEFTATDLNNKVDPGMNYTVAIRANISRQWQVGTGIQYSKIKEAIHLSGKETNTIYTVVKRLAPGGNNLVDDTVTTVTTGTRNISARNSYSLLSIPLFAQYNLAVKRNWSLSLSSGLFININAAYKNSIQGNLVTMYASPGIQGSKEHHFTMDIYAGMRIARRVYKNLHFFTEPSLRLNLTRYTLPGMVNYKNIHQAGISFGLSYTLPYWK